MVRVTRILSQKCLHVTNYHPSIRQSWGTKISVWLNSNKNTQWLFRDKSVRMSLLGRDAHLPGVLWLVSRSYCSSACQMYESAVKNGLTARLLCLSILVKLWLSTVYPYFTLFWFHMKDKKAASKHNNRAKSTMNQ